MPALASSDDLGTAKINSPKPIQLKESTTSPLTKSLRTLMTGALCNLPTKLFLDTGATHNFVSRAFVERHSLGITEAGGQCIALVIPRFSLFVA